MKTFLATMGLMGLMTAGAYAGPLNCGRGEIGWREHNQQTRIAQGIDRGRLSPWQASKLENREAHVRQEVRVDRMVNGGRLTPGEFRQVNRQLNSISRNIKRDER
jgi:hypothetical protein